VQTCTVHLIRAAMRFVNYQDRKAVTAALKPIYQAVDAGAARAELDAFASSELGRRYPNTVGAFEHAWQRFIPFLAFPPEVRRVISTTNAIESLNYQLRKVTKNRGHSPNRPGRREAAAAGHLQHTGQTRRDRERERGLPSEQRRAQPRLVEGQIITNWRKALAQLTLAHPDRIAPYL
jgi:transposase-like protein